MSDFKTIIREDMRLVILRLLAEMPAYRSNSSVLLAGLENFGHAPTRDTVKTEVQWLAEQDLVTVENVGPVVVATLTERGGDVAKGRAVVPGVKRPGA